MLERYRDIGICKNDINVFLELVENDIGSVPEERMRNIAKGILFNKKIFEYKNLLLKHYYECLLSDMLSLIHSLGVKSNRLFFTTYRSLIENFIRVCLKYEETNETGVRNMFGEFRSKYNSSEKEFIDYLEGEYGKCCNVVHSNIQGNLEMYSYYEELLQSDEMDESMINEGLQTMSTFYNKCKKFIVESNSVLMDEMFYNHKELLKYLIGESNYKQFERNIYSDE